MTPISISIIPADPAPDLSQLQRSATNEGYSSVDRTIEEWGSRVNRFDRPGEGFFIAGSGTVLVGMCGLNHDPYLNEPSVGRLRHLYVAPQMRRCGVGHSLVVACLNLASTVFERVRLRSFEPAASAFNLTMGFQVVDEPDATHSIAV